MKEETFGKRNFGALGLDHSHDRLADTRRKRLQVLQGGYGKDHPDGAYLGGDLYRGGIVLHAGDVRYT